ncbi:MAG: ATP-dependent DNA helicase RecG [Sandaracinaceae bacterium]|nr:ATP-dependent DNA helicase RecG [Sandaracinaceae bacterium]
MAHAGDSILRELSALVKEPDLARAHALARQLRDSVDDAGVQAAANGLAQAHDQSSVMQKAALALRHASRFFADRTPEPSQRSLHDRRKDQREVRRTAVLSKQQHEHKARDAAGALSVLDRPVETLPGVGPAVGRALRKRSLESFGDLVMIVPRRYDDERVITPLAELVADQRQVTMGVVATARAVHGRRRFVEVTIEPLPDDPRGHFGMLRLVWFQMHPRYADKFERGKRVRVAGEVAEYRGALTMSHPDVTFLDDGQTDAPALIVPRYPQVPGVAPKALARMIKVAVDKAVSALPDAVPARERGELDLPTIADTARALHNPPSDLTEEELALWNDGATGHHMRLAFEEFFVLELALAERQREERGVGAEALIPNDAPLARAHAAIPFTLTNAQKRALDEIGRDMRRDIPMRRLLQGDVGSGKTAVAMLAAAHAVASGAQVAIMAPTEVLSEQHFRSMAPLAKAIGLNIALVVGGARAAHRKQVRKALAEGTLDVVVGTHALLEDDVIFRKLRLVVVDEQHRFGVAQRLRLVQKASQGLAAPLAPHLLVMTATPIPRTLSLVVYGDLEASVIDEMPPGRIPITTRAYSLAERDRALATVQKALDAHGQAFVICPLVEESEESDMRDAVSTHAELSQRFAKEGVELLHGRMKAEDKHRAMERFASGEVKVLVSTTVVEVGVDVPKANVIMIEHAERFGLAQLHQLRGRVGRGGQKSACLLVHDAKGEDAVARMRILCETNDGFRIAEEDLRIRGPGEVFGRRQSGLPGFRFGDLRRDVALLEKARSAARSLLARDPDLNAPENRGSAHALERLSRSDRAVVREEAG